MSAFCSVCFDHRHLVVVNYKLMVVAAGTTGT